MINPETYNWDDLPENIEKAKQIRKNISEAGAVISDAILRYKKKKQSPQWTKENGLYIPNPLTWLNQKRWEDEPLEIKPEGGASANGRSKKAEPAVTGFHAAE